MTNPESERERFAHVLFYAVVLAIGYLAFSVVAPFLAALAWAAVFAMVMAPLLTRIERRINSTWAATLATVGISLLIVIPAVLVLIVLVREVTQIVRDFQQSGYAVTAPAKLQGFWDAVRARSPFPLPENLSASLASGVQKLATYVAGMAGSALQNLLSFVLQLCVMLFGLFFFLRDRHKVVGVIRHLLPFSPERRERMLKDTYDTVVATVGSTFAVAAVQGTLTGIALGVAGFRAPVFWGVMTSVCSLLPAVGSGIVWLPAVIWLFASGETVKAIVLLVFCAVVVGTADNVLRPVLLSGRTSMHGLVVFVSLMGGVVAFGFIGLVLGPVVLATLSTLLETVMPQDEIPAVPEGGPDARPGV
jgi:predicted PurR-regulated permease PerM